jgi:hypothetical protein
VPMHDSVERLFDRCHFCVVPVAQGVFKVSTYIALGWYMLTSQAYCHWYVTSM